MIKNVLLILIGFLWMGASKSPDEILKQIDRNMYSDNLEMTSSMRIYGERAERTLKAKTYSKGRKRSLTEFLEPPREKGVKMLKVDDNLWTYYPQADRIVKISGHMLRQSLMGSDLSYEDMMEDERLYDSYNATIIGVETFEDRLCYVMQLEARRQDQTYQLRKLWVDQERYVPLKEELYAKGGRLLKRVLIRDIKKVDTRWYPFSLVYKDMLTAGKGTELIIHDVIFDKVQPDATFAKGVLRR